MDSACKIQCSGDAIVLVAGATGLVGHAVCEKLVQRGERVRALVRPTSSKDKVENLRSWGVELFSGDLKEPDTIDDACRGMDAVISTASSTLSRQAGDSIESVDAEGQLNLVDSAKRAGVERFIFVSFRRPAGVSFPLGNAKEQVERAVSALNFTTILASWFMEVWLSPALGFDYANARARIYGSGTSPISWVSSRDVAEMCAVCLRHPMAERKVIEFGGPEALSPLQVVERFEKASGRSFQLDYVPEAALISQFEQATDSMQKSFAALMLGYLRGDAIDMTSVVGTFGISLHDVDEYVRSVLANARTV